jgi:hypothetical protein
VRRASIELGWRAEEAEALLGQRVESWYCARRIEDARTCTLNAGRKKFLFASR